MGRCVFHDLRLLRGVGLLRPLAAAGAAPIGHHSDKAHDDGQIVGEETPYQQRRQNHRLREDAAEEQVEPALTIQLSLYIAPEAPGSGVKEAAMYKLS